MPFLVKEKRVVSDTYLTDIYGRKFHVETLGTYKHGKSSISLSGTGNLIFIAFFHASTLECSLCTF